MDAVVGDDVKIEPHCLVVESRLEDGVTIGPFARLRTGTHVKRGGRIGNFVETKQAVIGEGAKVPHLTYLGDAKVGAKSNIGAGTITCNYDGFQKHPTTIGKGVFIGSDSVLVAPVHIGDHAYVAAGSTITENVPDDSLGIGRGRQVNKPGWASRKRRELAAQQPPGKSSRHTSKKSRRREKKRR